MYKIAMTAMSAVAAVLLIAACSREAPPEGVNAKGATAAPVPKKPEAGAPAASADPLKEGY